jgi:hypothetical protein
MKHLMSYCTVCSVMNMAVIVACAMFVLEVPQTAYQLQLASDVHVLRLGSLCWQRPRHGLHQCAYD